MEHYYFEVEVKKNEVPSFTKTTPVKESTVEFTYTFTGWDKTIVSVIGNEKYVAQYNKSFYRYVDSTQKQIYFGSYPQTKVTDSSIISQLDNLTGDLPTQYNLSKWTDYEYYIDGKVISYMYYQDITLDNNKYRAVYFTSYTMILYLLFIIVKHKKQTIK